MPRKTPFPFVHRVTDRYGCFPLLFPPPRLSVRSAAGALWLGGVHRRLSSGDGREAPSHWRGAHDRRQHEAVIVSYYQSAEFKGLRASTARVYRNILERFREAHGDKSAVGMRTKHVRKLMAEKATTPDAANRMLGMISILMEQAIALGLRDDNPCGRRQKVEAQGRRLRHVERRPDRQLSRFPLPGSRERLVLELALGTAQRRGDLVRLGWRHVGNGAITISKARPARLSPSPLSASLEPPSICRARHARLHRSGGRAPAGRGEPRE